MSDLYEYYILPPVLRKAPARLHTQLEGEAVALIGGPYDYEIPGNSNRPPLKMHARVATPEDMEALYNQGCPSIGRRKKKEPAPEERADLPKKTDTDKLPDKK